MSEELNTENATGFVWRGKQFSINESVYEWHSVMFSAHVQRCGEGWKAWVVEGKNESTPAVHVSRSGALDLAVSGALRRHERLVQELLAAIKSPDAHWHGKWRGLQFERTAQTDWWTCFYQGMVWSVHQGHTGWSGLVVNYDDCGGRLDGELRDTPERALAQVASAASVALVQREVALHDRCSQILSLGVAP